MPYDEDRARHLCGFRNPAEPIGIISEAIRIMRRRANVERIQPEQPPHLSEHMRRMRYLAGLAEWLPQSRDGGDVTGGANATAPGRNRRDGLAGDALPAAADALRKAIGIVGTNANGLGLARASVSLVKSALDRAAAVLDEEAPELEAVASAAEDCDDALNGNTPMAPVVVARVLQALRQALRALFTSEQTHGTPKLLLESQQLPSVSWKTRAGEWTVAENGIVISAPAQHLGAIGRQLAEIL